MGEARSSERPPAAPSAVFGKYQLLASLGQGGMADVFLAVARGLVGFNKLVVIKRLRASLAEEPEFLPMFLDEARLAARLNHPNVVQTNEVGEVDGEFFIAMEYLEGQPLNRILSRSHRRKAPVPMPIYLHMISEALAGLHHAHELKDFDGSPLHVVHRDATPHNIFVTYEGITKLVDFGIAKAATRSYETRTGVLKGKLHYMAPEQARCEDVDRRADIFSLGSVLWELLTGQRLWAGLTDVQVLEKLASTTPASPRTVAPEVPEEVERICMRALSRDRDDRYPTAAELREDLDAFIREHARCSSRDVASFVQGLFADKREQIRVIVERQLARAHTGAELVDIHDPSNVTSSTDGLQVLGTGSTSAPRSGTPTSVAPAEGDSTGPHSATQSSRGTPSGIAPRSTSPDRGEVSEGAARSRRAWIAAAVVGAVAIGLFAVRRGNDEASPERAAATPGGVVTPTPPTASEDDGGGTRLAAAKTVSVRVEARPADARITIDDTPVPTNPFEGRFPADGMTHRIVVEAKGFKTERRMVTFDRDASATFDLAAGEDKDERARPVGPAQPAYPPAGPPPPRTGAATAEPAPAPPPGPRGPGQPVKRPLEKGDPWGN